jgi:protein phosphatase
MQACPHCQFTNPDNNRFCQKCGGALVEDLSSPSAALPNTALPNKGLRLEDIEIAAVANAVSVDRYAILSGAVSQLAARQFLDDQQRYQLTADLPTGDLNAQIEAIVIDSQPLQPPILDEFYRQQIGYPSAPAPGQTRSIPAAAQPYLELRKRHPFLPLPKIHDAWEQAGLSVILLEERSHFPALLSLWGGQALLVEIIEWLDEMIELWAALQPQGCGRSLLVLKNLRVDDDGLLCLQRLYQDDPAQPARLKDLGEIWQQLFAQSQRTHRGDIAQLCHDLQTGNVTFVDELRSRLKLIKESADTSAPNTSAPNTSAPNTSAPNTSASASSPAPPSLADLMNLGNAALPAWDEETDDSEEMTRSSSDYSTVALPMQLISFEDAGLTDIGCQRNHNEDCFSLQSETQKVESPQGRMLQTKGLYILCDGMGGHAGGEVASALAVDTLKTYFAQNWHDRLPNEAQIREAIALANRAIFDLNQERASSGSGRMGTTLAMALVQDDKLAIAHVGDSRIYRFSARNGLEQIMIDHEVGQREMQKGIEEAIAYARPDAYQLTQALGPRDESGIKPDVSFLDLNEDMLLLLCSDGLTDNNLLETHWESHLTPLLSGQMSLDVGVSHLVELANQHNGHDNITAIVVRLRFMASMLPTMMADAV